MFKMNVELHDQVQQLTLGHRGLYSQSEDLGFIREEPKRQQQWILQSQFESPAKDEHTIYWQEAHQAFYLGEGSRGINQSVNRSDVQMNTSNILNDSIFENAQVHRRQSKIHDQQIQQFIRQQNQPGIKQAKKANKKIAQDSFMEICQQRQERKVQQPQDWKQYKITSLDEMIPRTAAKQKQKTEMGSQAMVTEPRLEKPTQESIFKRVTSQRELQKQEVVIKNIQPFGPLLMCSGIDGGQRIEFIYKPGFEHQIQRPNLFESAMDYEYAEKPLENHKYIIHYRTTNSQNQIMVEKLERLD